MGRRPGDAADLELSISKLRKLEVEWDQDAFGRAVIAALETGRSGCMA
jgi:hypothetical protein